MRSKILNQYRTELGKKVWCQYALGERKYGTRNNLMAFSCRPDFKTSSVMRGGGGKAKPFVYAPPSTREEEIIV